MRFIVCRLNFPAKASFFHQQRTVLRCVRQSSACGKDASSPLGPHPRASLTTCSRNHDDAEEKVEGIRNERRIENETRERQEGRARAQEDKGEKRWGGTKLDVKVVYTTPGR